MNFKRWTALAVVALALVVTTIGCGSLNIVAKQEPTAVASRTPRPTFTPHSEATDTPEATNTPQITPTTIPTQAVLLLPTQPPPTQKPTVKPIVQPTLKPKPATPIPQPQPTQPPPQPTAVPKPAFQYSFIPASCNTTDPAVCNIQNGVRCEHSGQHQIKVLVFDDFRDPNSEASGVYVRYSFSPGGAPIDPDEQTGGDGAAVKTFSGVTDPPSKGVGTYYVWVISKPSGTRISNYSPAISLNALSENDPKTCWVATVSFAGGQ